MLGDGATIKIISLINILGLFGDKPPVLLGIHDFTHHMALGGKKCTRYIANLYDRCLEQLDPGKMNVFVDVFFFDGASNVQEAGEFLAACNTGSNFLHGG